MTQEPEMLTLDKFQEIHTNEKFRNEVAHAHQCCDKNSVFKYFSTCSWPTRYKVSKEQIEEAKELREKARIETLEKHKNALLFVGMGMTYEPRYEDDVCNHRIRTEFLNSKGKRYFIEVGTGRGDEMRCDFAIDRDMQVECKDSIHREGEFYNFHGLERNQMLPKYMLSTVLMLVNQHFDCKFTEIIIDDHNISADGLICQSPK